MGGWYNHPMSFVRISDLYPPQDHALQTVRLLSSLWSDFTGEHACFSEPLSLKRGTLTISCSSDETAGFLKNNRNEIAKNVNAMIGTQAVQRIRWVFGRSCRIQPLELTPVVPDPDIINMSGVIKDDDLREQFIRAAAVCLSRQNES